MTKVDVEGTSQKEEKRESPAQDLSAGTPIKKVDDVVHDGFRFHRQAIRTRFFNVGDSYTDFVRHYIAPKVYPEEHQVLFVSEKIIALAQNRIVRKEEISPGFFARFLSRFVLKTPAGPALRNHHKMQLTIDIVGLPRVLLAAMISAITKPFGVRGMFYRVVGNGIAGIDGFYGEAFDEYAEYAILNPTDCDDVCQRIAETIGIPVSIVDANDLNVETLGRSLGFPFEEEAIKRILSQNPAGQDDETTPLVLVSYRDV